MLYIKYNLLVKKSNCVVIFRETFSYENMALVSWIVAINKYFQSPVIFLNLKNFVIKYMNEPVIWQKSVDPDTIFISVLGNGPLIGKCQECHRLYFTLVNPKKCCFTRSCVKRELNNSQRFNHSSILCRTHG